MAGDWIKMRASLENSPKVIAIAKQLEADKSVGRSLSTGFGGALREIVTRDVTRDVTVMSLFRVWCAANEHTSDGVWHGIELDDLDQVARIKGFGRMMEAVGWAVFDADNNTVTFPNFLEYNAPAKEGRDKGAAERQRRYREKQRQNTAGRCATGDVTRDVTLRVTSDVEKRREEKSINEIPKGISSPEQSSEPAGDSGYVFALQTGTWHLPAKGLAEYVATYRFDVGQELRKAAQWLRDNKDRRPRTGTGIKKFLTRWLNRVDGNVKTSAPTGRVRSTIDSDELARTKAIREARKRGQLSNAFGQSAVEGDSTTYAGASQEPVEPHGFSVRDLL